MTWLVGHKRPFMLDWRAGGTEMVMVGPNEPPHLFGEREREVTQAGQSWMGVWLNEKRSSTLDWQVGGMGEVVGLWFQ